MTDGSDAEPTGGPGSRAADETAGRPTDEPASGPRRLLVLRHAAAEPGGPLGDERRPLTIAGRRQSVAVGAWLAAAGLVPDRVLVSSAVRARQTWELARGALGAASSAEVDVRDDLYTAAPQDVVALLRQVDAHARTVLVVGHEPTMSGLAALLAATGGDTGHLAQVRAGLPTAACAVLAPGSWAGLSGGDVPLLDVVRPDR